MAFREALRGLFGAGREPEGEARPVRIGLALGGGGVRGAAHLGALSVLERAGVSFDVVAGTSIGAVVGAGVAARVSPDVMLERFRKTRWLDLARPSWGSRISMFDINPMADILIDTVCAKTFEELSLPLAVVTSDLLTAETVVFTSGPLREAVLASAAVPGIFEPVRRDGRLLVDGGLTENLPVAEALDLGADIVIAVDITPAPDPSYEPKDINEMLMLSWSMVEWVRESGRENAAVVITPQVARFSMMDLGQVQKIYEAGVEAGEAALGEVLAAIRQASQALPAGRA